MWFSLPASQYCSEDQMIRASETLAIGKGPLLLFVLPRFFCEWSVANEYFFIGIMLCFFQARTWQIKKIQVKGELCGEMVSADKLHTPFCLSHNPKHNLFFKSPWSLSQEGARGQMVVEQPVLEVPLYTICLGFIKQPLLTMSTAQCSYWERVTCQNWGLKGVKGGCAYFPTERRMSGSHPQVPIAFQHLLWASLSLSG